MFSPRWRGYTDPDGFRHVGVVVFPALAGVYRGRQPNISWGGCFPRAGGGVPQLCSVTIPEWEFSPRWRGCTDKLLICLLIKNVFPALAGVYLATMEFIVLICGFPRAGGGVPCPACRSVVV